MIMEGLGFYLLRTPRLPLQAIAALNSCRDERTMDAALRSLVADPDIREALAYASPALCRQLEGRLRDVEEPLPPGLRQTLYKYLIRMATRPTPYGLFAGVSCGTVCDAGSAICLVPEHRPVVRPDMGVLAALARQLEGHAGTRRELTYHTNNTLTQLDGHVRYYAYRSLKGDRRFERQRMENTRLLAMVTTLAQTGIHYRRLLTALTGAGLSGWQADAYLDALVRHQVLVTDLEPSVTGAGVGFTEHTVRAHAPLAGIMDAALGMQRLSTLLSPGDRWTSLPGVAPADAPLFQCDLLTGTAANRLNRQVLDTIVSEIRDLLPLRRQPMVAELRAFAHRFSARYGDRWVPLLEALDTERGVGYGSEADFYRDAFPLIEGLPFHREREFGGEVPDEILRVVAGKWTGQHTVELDKKDLAAIAGRQQGDDFPLPPTAYVLGSLLAADADALDRGAFRFQVSACGGCSALPLMARFAHLDKGLETQLLNMTAREQLYFDDAVLAEIVHLPNDRHGNILHRPHLRHYEIPVYTPSTLPEEQQIPLADLWVGIRGARMALYSRRLGKRVVPRLASAHNPVHGMAIYRFLCDAQHETGSLDLTWDWAAFGMLAFLPRVTYGHLVLSRARWRITRRSFPDRDVLAAVRQLREEFALPGRVVLADADRELLLELEQPVAAALLVDGLRRGDIHLHEYLPDPACGPVIDRSGQPYAHELVIPMHNAAPAPPMDGGSPTFTEGPHSLAPGSRWLYFKCYMGHREAERLLAAAIGPLLKRWRRNGWIDAWFFVRYADPAPHLRIRVRTAHPTADPVRENMLDGFHRVMDRYMDGQGADKWQLDTYQRELERYHPDCIDDCEAIFHADSRMVLALLSAFAGEDGQQLRWMAACGGTAMLLEAFGYDMHHGRSLVRTWASAFLQEQGGGKPLRIAIDKRYRMHKMRLDTFMSGGEAPLVHRALHIRSFTIAPFADRIRQRLSTADPRMLEQVVSGLVHMSLNRFFYANPRENELVVYHFLAKHFDAMAHRGGSIISRAPSLA